MAQNGSSYKRLILAVLLGLWTVAFAMAQGGMVVTEGETKTYQVENHSGSSYVWNVYNEAGFTTAASDSEVRIVSGENTSSLSVTWLKPGTYYPTVVETDLKGCINTKAIVITVQEGTIPWPVAKISNETILIGGQDYILTGTCKSLVIDASSSTGDGLTFQWEPSIYLDNPKSPTPIFLPGIITTYQLTVTDIYGRSSSLSVGVKVAAEVHADAGENLYTDGIQSVMLDGSKSSGENLEYLWQTGNGHILEGNTTSNPIVDQPGKYLLTITDPFGCTDQDSVQVNLYVQAVKDTDTTKVNYAIDINVLANDIPQNSLNSATLRIVSMPKNGSAVVQGDSLISYTPNQYYVGSDEFVYSICDYSNDCDDATVLVIIDDIPFFIPEAFSPNGDGINDRFEIKGLEKYKTVEIQIFNRWGNIVYQSNNYGVGDGKEGFWDGTGQTRTGGSTGPVPTGTYYYILKAPGSKNISESIYLDR
jgi:gliding motility-associated-like protein